MFDLNKLGDMAKIANEAKKVQEQHEKLQREQNEILLKMSNQLDKILHLLENAVRK
ncbi:MAG: hypothetical protein HQL30_01680 [Candidatus Omnitrophica bacterium]|nr:hypothetical protein [Candidatus Omnitrophota bacterium]